MSTNLSGDIKLDDSMASASHWISLGYFCAARLAVAFLMLSTAWILSRRIVLGVTNPELFLKTILFYVLSSAGFLGLAFWKRQQFYLQLLIQLVVDVCVLTLLTYSSGGASGGLSVLFLLPVAGAAILVSITWALFFAALSTLAILGESLWRQWYLEWENVNFIQTGLYGAALFAIALVINRLAARLITQEQIAKQRGQDLNEQIEINRVIVEDMQDGVLILSSQGELRALNPAAMAMLRVKDMNQLIAAGWNNHPAGKQINQHFFSWHEASCPESMAIDVALTLSEAHCRLRLRFMKRPSDHPTGGHYVVFLEDLLRIEERAQQLKLASMGRLTASIAHEIRNPLAAISYAASLMPETDEAGLSRERLLTIVQENTKRLNRIVENILQLARRSSVELEHIELAAYLPEIVEDFCRDQNCSLQTIDLVVYGHLVMRFNAEHLRQVMVNLLQNAHRYASGQAGSIRITAVPVNNAQTSGGSTTSSIQRIELVVQDDGPGVDKEVSSHLFEPFFTTSHLGTGLGLYLARELCLVNHATLNYLSNTQQSKKAGFVISANAVSQ